MAKIQNDKYYTSPELAKYCVEKTKEIIGEDNITEYIEPSAGSGVFLNYLDKPYLAYDIEPENNKVKKQDWLSLELDYKQGRCIIGNPPFGNRNTLSVKFFKKSISISDYVSFILPISQLNNNQQMYEFDLIYSEDLGLQHYSDRDLHCCFNIYRRPVDGKLNSKPNYKLKDISIYEIRQGLNKTSYDYDYFDYSLCNLGRGQVGKRTLFIGQYAHELYIKINNEKFKDIILHILQNTNWENDICNGISGQVGLYQWQIYKYLKEQIPELE